MDFQDMKKYMQLIQISKINDSYKYSYLKDTHEEGSYAFFKLNVEESGEYTFCISQKGERMFPRDSGYQYSNVRMILMRSTESD